MTSAAKQNASPPEFLIQRNLILQKRSTSLPDNGEDSGNSSSNSDASIGGPLRGANEREKFTSSGALAPRGTTIRGVPARDEKPWDYQARPDEKVSSHFGQPARGSRSRGNTASGSAVVNGRYSRSASETETLDRDAYSEKKPGFLTRTGRKMGEDFSEAPRLAGNRANFSGKASSDSGSDISVVNGDIERIISANGYDKTRAKTNGLVSKESESPQEQEFSYGPGFVDKLKSRFISLSLRDKVKSGNALRRFSSLENVLDSDAEYPNGDVIERKRPIGTANNAARVGRFDKSAPAKGSFKRAKSMETLLLESERRKIPGRGGNGAASDKNRPVSMIESATGRGALGLINENLVIIESPKGESRPEKTDNVVNNNNNVSNRLNNNKNATRLSTNISDEELPKPDIVKNRKLIFETGVKNVGPVNGTTANVVAPTAITNANNTRDGKIATATTVTTTTTKPRSAKIGVTANDKNSPKTFATRRVATNNASAKDLVNETKVANENNLNKDSGTKEPVVVTKDSPVGGGTERDVVFTNGEVFRNDGSVSPSNGTTPDSEIKQRRREEEEKEDAKAKTSAIPEGVKERRFSPATNSSNAMVFNGATINGDSLGGGGLSKSLLPRPPTLRTHEPVVAQTPKTSPLTSKEVASPLSPPRGGNDARGVASKNGSPLLVPETPAAPETTSPTSELAEETTPKVEEDVLKPSTLTGNKKPGLWQKAPRMTTTVVYDFRGKDVKPHLPTNPAPFGCAPTRSKKKKRTDNKEGLRLKNGAVDLADFSGGESNDYEDSDEEYDETDVGAHLPDKSGITFVGENAKCSKSSLLTIRDKKLKIQFDDDATSTFEYPSEEWIYEDASTLLANSANLLETVLSPDNQRPQPATEDANDEDSKVPNTGLRNTPGLASTGGLSNYTPSMLSSTDNSFQLGVSRMAKEEPSTPKESSVDSPTSSPVTGSHTDEDDLLPADPEQTSSWSSSTSTSDLLF